MQRDAASTVVGSRGRETRLHRRRVDGRLVAVGAADEAAVAAEEGISKFGDAVDGARGAGVERCIVHKDLHERQVVVLQRVAYGRQLMRLQLGTYALLVNHLLL